MRHALRLHPDSPFVAAIGLEVEVLRPGADSLVLSYMVTGRLDALCLPPVVAASRGSELWRHTCFEAFIRTSADCYHEFNFAPSTAWAVYRFSGYRSGLRVARECAAPLIEVEATPERFMLQATLDLSWLSAARDEFRWRLGLSALIEGKTGRQSYWALAHPSGKPDFHHPDCFALAFPEALAQ